MTADSFVEITGNFSFITVVVDDNDDEKEEEEEDESGRFFFSCRIKSDGNSPLNVANCGVSLMN